MEEVTAKSQKTNSLNSIAKQRERRLVEYFVVVSSVAQNDPENPIQDDDDESGREDGVPTKLARVKSEDTESEEEEEEDDDDDVDVDDDSEGEDEDEEEFVDDYDFQPVITSRYPQEDHPGNPLHQSITCFCHPTGSISLRNDPSMPKVRQFTL